MTSAYDAEILSTLENLIAPGGRVRLSPYIESVQFRILFGDAPEDPTPSNRVEKARQLIDEHQAHIAHLAKLWAKFVQTGRKDFTAYPYQDQAYLDAYLAYYCTTNVGKIQLSLLDLLRKRTLPSTLAILDVGVGTGTTLLGILDFLVLWSHVCDLYNAAFPIVDVTYTGLDQSDGCRRYGERVARAYADALRARHAAQAEAGTTQERAIGWATSAAWLRHDVNTRPYASTANLIVASNVINELSDDGKHNIAEMIAAAGVSALALIIEPGDQQDTQGLMTWRRKIVQHFPQVTNLGPCGAELGASLPAACQGCWPARRTSSTTDGAFPTLRTSSFLGAIYSLADRRTKRQHHSTSGSSSNIRVGRQRFR